MADGLLAASSGNACYGMRLTVSLTITHVVVVPKHFYKFYSVRMLHIATERLVVIFPFISIHLCSTNCTLQDGRTRNPYPFTWFQHLSRLSNSLFTLDDCCTCN